MLYWTDWGTKPKIESAWMDGQHREVLLDGEDLGWPTGLVVDYMNGNRIYWCDAKENIIESMKPDGTERKIIISGGQNSEMLCINCAEIQTRPKRWPDASSLSVLQTSDIPTVWMCLRDTCTGRLKTKAKCGG